MAIDKREECEVAGCSEPVDLPRRRYWCRFHGERFFDLWTDEDGSVHHRPARDEGGDHG